MYKLTQKVVASGMSLVLAVGLTPLPAFAAQGDLSAASTALSAQATKYLNRNDVTLPTSVHVYDGTAFTPKPVVTYDGKVLTEGTDYTLSYYDNDGDENAAPTEVGYYQVRVTGIGEYTNDVTKSFRISEPVDSWSNVEVTISGAKDVFEHTGSPVKPDVVVRIPDINKTLAANADYTVKYATSSSSDAEAVEPVEAGYYYAIVTPAGAYAKEGASAKSVDYRIVNAKNLESADFVWPAPDYRTFAYTGSALAPKPVVLINGKALVEGTDYSVKYQKYDENAQYVEVQPTEVGNYRIRIEGINAYASTTDEPNVTYDYFFIESGKDINRADVRFDSGDSFAYTGSPIQPKPVVSYRGKTLVENTDYVLSYDSDRTVEPGSYTINIRGINAYRGTKPATYEIYNPNDFSAADVTLPNDRYYFAYTGAAQLIKPEKVELYDKAITSYTIAYKTSNGYWINEPKEPGSYTMYLIGTGAYAGQVNTKGRFQIVEKNSLAAATVSMETNYTYNGKAVKPKPVVTLGGKTLKSGKDYTISYYGTEYGTYTGQKKIASPKNAGSYMVKIMPKGTKYIDSKSQAFEINQVNLGNASEVDVALKADSFASNGKNVKPAVVVKLNGKKVKASNYLVAYPTESKAIGGYSVTVVGDDKNFTGSKTLSFTVGPKTTKLKKVTAKSKGFTATWKKLKKNNKGYQVRYSVNKDMSNAKTKTVKKAKKTALSVSKLKANTKYYVQLRTMGKVDGTAYYGAWTKAKAVTTR